MLDVAIELLLEKGVEVLEHLQPGRIVRPFSVLEQVPGPQQERLNLTSALARHRLRGRGRLGGRLLGRALLAGRL
ncbi:MAG: hypothetical protein ABI571_06180, partial [Actinomycetota bacterium]